MHLRSGDQERDLPPLSVTWLWEDVRDAGQWQSDLSLTGLSLATAGPSPADVFYVFTSRWWSRYCYVQSYVMRHCNLDISETTTNTPFISHYQGLLPGSITSLEADQDLTEDLEDWDSRQREPLLWSHWCPDFWGDLVHLIVTNKALIKDICLKLSLTKQRWTNTAIKHELIYIKIIGFFCSAFCI